MFENNFRKLWVNIPGAQWENLQKKLEHLGASILASESFLTTSKRIHTLGSLNHLLPLKIWKDNINEAHNNVQYKMKILNERGRNSTF